MLLGGPTLGAGGEASALSCAPSGCPPTCGDQIATIVGSPGRDLIVGTHRRDVIAARGGADRVRGRGGEDTICGDRGDDRLQGGGGNDGGPETPSDPVVAGSGIKGGKGQDLIGGGAGNDYVSGGRAADHLAGDEDEDRCIGGRPEPDRFPSADVASQTCEEVFGAAVTAS